MLDAIKWFLASTYFWPIAYAVLAFILIRWLNKSLPDEAKAAVVRWLGLKPMQDALRLRLREFGFITPAEPTKKTRKIFLCYRRDDTGADTGRIHDRLALEFGEKNIFMDVDSMRLGQDFVDRLTAEVQSCDALLAVIGPNWLDARDEEGNRRIDNPDDFVRIEIGAALQRDIPVIPILLNGTKIPRADRLPPELQKLARRSALDVRHGSFRSDTDRLIADLKQSP